MKTLAHNLQTLSLLALLLCITGSTKAQVEGIDNFQGYTADTSIIREWKNGYVIIYSISPTNGAWIHISHTGSSAYESIKITDTLRDMEVLDDTAYYCGNDALGNPLIGYFCIPDILTTGGTIIHRVEQTSSMRHHLNRMGVFNVEDGVHIVAIGDLYNNNGLEFRFISDISHYYPNGAWTLYYYIDAEQIEFFDDITVTDKYIVTSEHKHLSGAIYMRMYEKPTTAQPANHSTTIRGSMFHSQTLPPIYYNVYSYSHTFGIIEDHITDYPVWITHTTGDSVAIACLSQNSLNNDFGYTLKVFDVNSIPGTLIINNDLFFDLGSTLNRNWKVQDLRFDSLNNKILMLHTIDNNPTGSTESIFSSFDNSVPTNAFGYFTNTNIIHHSFDKFNTIPQSLTQSGECNNHTLMWSRNSQQATLCFTACIHTANKENSSIGNFVIEINNWEGSLYESTEYISAIVNTKHNICN